MPQRYTISEFADRYHFSGRREVIRLICQGELIPLRLRGNSYLTENDFVRYVQRKHVGLCN